ncbi:hypothetical protein EZV62_019661 [Acer yangbiense]|uniref:DUF4408 domain-containing protein n=1 Tax=Acer yangbiense TaxID=1000413 RepID=A0A5C7HCT9_9ROSI|nr:hypothetical protein EZV62_019661 [Acer yangbiense]
MKKYSQKQRVVENFFIYSLTALAFSLILSSPFWFPSMKAFLFVSLPKAGFVLLSPKVLFIVGNLIVVVLVGESRFFAPKPSPASNVYYDEYISRKELSKRADDFIARVNRKRRLEATLLYVAANNNYQNVNSMAGTKQGSNSL